MELTQLEAFVAVAEELHFSRAAQRRHLSQSAITKQIRQLEDMWGVALFERNRRRVKLTLLGSALLEGTRNVLAANQQLQRLARQLKGGQSGELRLAFTPTAPQHVLPDLLRRFRQQLPLVQVQLQELSSAAQLLAVARGDIDLGIVRSSGAPAGPALASPSPGALAFYPLLEERLLVAVAQHNSLAKRRVVSLKSLESEAWVLVQRAVSPQVYDTILAACQRAGFAPRVLQTGSQLHATLALVAAGLGICIVPESARRFRPRGVSFVPLRETLVSRIDLVCSAQPSPIAQRFVKLCAER